MSGFIFASVQILELMLNILQLLILASVIIFIIDVDPKNTMVKIIRKLTEPIYNFIRRFIPTGKKLPFDLAPLLVWCAVIFIQKFIQYNLIIYFK